MPFSGPGWQPCRLCCPSLKLGLGLRCPKEKDQLEDVLWKNYWAYRCRYPDALQPWEIAKSVRAVGRLRFHLAHMITKKTAYELAHLVVVIGFTRVYDGDTCIFFWEVRKMVLSPKPWVSIIKCSNFGCFGVTAVSGHLREFPNNPWLLWLVVEPPHWKICESCWGSSCDDSTLGNPKEWNHQPDHHWLYGCVWKCCVPHCTQWFSWSLSRF